MRHASHQPTPSSKPSSASCINTQGPASPLAYSCNHASRFASLYHQRLCAHHPVTAMGGSAFTTGRSHPLSTPRMPKGVYNAVKARCHAILQEHYLCVASPIDGPGKTNFGDVDFLLAWPVNQSASKHEAFNTIAEALKATDAIMDKGKDVSGHLALPWPPELSPAFNGLQQGALDNSCSDVHTTPDNPHDTLHAKHHHPLDESTPQTCSGACFVTPVNPTSTVSHTRVTPVTSKANYYKHLRPTSIKRIKTKNILSKLTFECATLWSTSNGYCSSMPMEIFGTFWARQFDRTD